MCDFVYLDYAATTPCDPRVVQAMLPFFDKKFGNPNSLHHFGEEAAEALAQARQQVALLLGATSSEIIFISGATEANRLVLTKCSSTKRVITTKTEHKSILDVAAKRTDSIFLKVDKEGLINLSELEAQLTEEIGLVSICLVNNETGTIQNLKAITKLCHEKGILVHTDATQGFGKIPIDVKDLDVDFLTASGHKIYGPKGIGLLYFKKEHLRFLRVRGANNEVEFGIRAGTVPVSLCVGLGTAAEIALKEMAVDAEKISNLRERFIKGITGQLGEIYVNGAQKSYYPGIINMSFRGCEGEALMMETSKICVSSGSACTSNKLSISHVLDAMGLPPDIAQSSLRISIGRFTTKEEIELAIDALVKATVKLRAMSPLWDLIKAGQDIDKVFSCRRAKQ